MDIKPFKETLNLHNLFNYAIFNFNSYKYMITKIIYIFINFHLIG